MTNPISDDALNQLTSEFPDIPARIVVDIFCGYLRRNTSVPAAADATRARIVDACASTDA
jgi:hypothetical protein